MEHYSQKNHTVFEQMMMCEKESLGNLRWLKDRSVQEKGVRARQSWKKCLECLQGSRYDKARKNGNIYGRGTMGGRKWRMERQRMMIIRGGVLRERAVMQKQKVDKTNFFTLLVFLKMLNQARKTLNFRTVGKWSERTSAEAYNKQYGSEAVKHTTNIEKISQLSKHSPFLTPLRTSEKIYK
ncbi:MAG: hypothetical protein H9535_15075 [Ignavibacteria bacterium]|nr:hypothetical protein [Ignavibacteria bacterium]